MHFSCNDANAVTRWAIYPVAQSMTIQNAIVHTQKTEEAPAIGRPDPAMNHLLASAEKNEEVLRAQIFRPTDAEMHESSQIYMFSTC